jgi:hypothetical protein
MRGKKADPEFLSSFIAKCIGLNKTSQDEIVQTAQQEINFIDQKIIEVEKMKLLRSKLLDVISVFSKTETSHKEEAKILSFFHIQHPRICKYICSFLKKGSTKMDMLYVTEFSKSDIMFCVKQLQEHKVISKVGDHLIRGDKFDDYIKFVLCEA